MVLPFYCSIVKSIPSLIYTLCFQIKAILYQNLSDFLQGYILKSKKKSNS